ncbi:MAG: protease modulator HflK [Verrucomicrobiota bacterium]
MEQNTQKNGLINLVALLLIGAAGFVAARVFGSLAGQVASVFLGLGALVAALSWFQGRLEVNEQLEKLEFDELMKSKGGSGLFESQDVESFPAQRSREQFERYFVPVFTLLLLAAESAAVYFIWRWLRQPALDLRVAQPITPALLFLLFAFVLFLLGRFSATLARLENLRLLRPGASYLLLNAFLSFVVTVGLIGVWANYPKTDFYIAQGICVLLGLVAVETLANLVLELYRPRVKGKVQRPLYESRLVGLLGRPDGLVTTAAQALDYQFGFKVSETWFYRFFEKALVWLILFQLAVLLLSTSVVFIEPGEQAVREHLGRPAGTELLGPGPHLKWPWPIDRVYRVRTAEIQSFNVGFTPDPALEMRSTVLWTVPHTKEEQNFLVASRGSQPVEGTNAPSGKRPPPVSLMTVSIPVQFEVSNLRDWMYHDQRPSELLQALATREVVRYFVSADLNEVLSRQRADASQILRERIQAAADAEPYRLGVRIVFVGLQDIHPPVKVAGEYEKVVAATQTKQALILAARAEEVKTNALAEAAATNILNEAVAARVTREIGALAQAALFTNQIPAFEAAPGVYSMRMYLDMFGRATASARKYIVLTTNTEDIVSFDLQDKIREDLLNISVPTKK